VLEIVQGQSREERAEQARRAVGAYLVFGLVFVVVSSLAFYTLSTSIEDTMPVAQFDQQLANAIRQNTLRSTADVFNIITFAGNEMVFIVTVLLGIGFIVRRYWRGLITLLVGMGGALLLVNLIKDAVGRTRPVFDEPFQVINNFSFPSGHAFFAVMFYGLITYFLFRRVRSPLLRAVIILIALIMIIIIGLSRMILGVHFLSDVVGGYLGGLAWLVFTLTAIEYAVRRRAIRRTV
jgi:membrane-associated phospholipid phosphatase